jgi:hypothetical protein
VISLGASKGCGTYGIGQPSVFYKDGQFNIYYTCNVAGWPDQIRMARSSNATNWGSFTTHEIVAYGAGIDVKWNSALNKYVMVYSIGDWITPDPVSQNTYNVYVFTSLDGKIWNGYTTPMLYQICTDATDITLTGFSISNTRGFANLMSTDQFGCLNNTTMKAVFMQGDMHAQGEDWRAKAATWNLYSASFALKPWQLASDFNNDGTVDAIDLIMLANKWLSTGSIGSIPEDIAPQPNGDGNVDFLDFAFLAEEWVMIE